MRPVDKMVYSFVTREGEGEGGSAFKINEGIFKGTIYKYSHTNILISPCRKKMLAILDYPFNMISLIMGGMKKKSIKKTGSN